MRKKTKGFFSIKHGVDKQPVSSAAALVQIKLFYGVETITGELYEVHNEQFISSDEEHYEAIKCYVHVHNI